MNKHKEKNEDLLPFEAIPEVKSSIPIVGKFMPDAGKTLQIMSGYDNILALREYGPICRVGNTVYVNDIDLAKQIIQSDKDFYKQLVHNKNGEEAINSYGRGGTVESLSTVMGKSGPITIETNLKWKKLRGILARFVGKPGMSKELMIEELLASVDSVISQFDLAVENNEAVDVLEVFSKANLEVVLRGVLGARLGDKDTEVYFKALQKALGVTIFPAQFGYDASKIPILKGVQARAMLSLDEFTDKVILAALKMGEQGTRNLIVDLNDSGEFDVDDVKSIVQQVIAAGHETSASATANVMKELANRPELLAELKGEIASFNLKNGDFESLHNYMRAGKETLMYRVINETLRLYPPTFFIPANVKAEEGVILGDHHLPYGTEIQVVLLNILRDPRIFKNPDAFDPNRYLKDSELYTPEQMEALLIFWGGPRSCIGEELAMTTMFANVAALVSRYDSMEVVNDGGVSTMSGVTKSVKLKIRPKNSTIAVEG